MFLQMNKTFVRISRLKYFGYDICLKIKAYFSNKNDLKNE